MDLCNWRRLAHVWRYCSLLVMSNVILATHYPTPSNSTLISHGWPSGSSSNSTLASHDSAYPSPGGGAFSAILNTSTGVMNITGTGFGVKTTYAPTWLKSWYGVAHDTLATNPAVGLDRYHTDNPEPRITTAEAGFGGNPLRLYHPVPDGLNEGYSLHPQKFIAPTTEVLMSHWMKVSCELPWSGGLPQIKHHRVGYGQDSSAYDNYENINPRVGITKVHHSSDLSLPLISEDEKPRYWATNSTGSSTGDLYDQPTNPTGVAYDTWVFTETYFKWNDVGSTNGIVETWVNNQLYCSSVHRATPYAVRLTAGDTIRNVQFMPGIQSVNTGSPYINPDFTVLLSRPFVDSGSQSRKQVFLGNAATLSACTGKFMLPATSWGDTAITVNECRSVPANFDYVYVTNDSGAVLASGAYTSV